MKFYRVMVLCILSVFASCAPLQEAESSGRFRVVMEGEPQSSIRAYAYLEGADGGVPTGALVLAQDPLGGVTILSYKPEKGAFSVDFPAGLSGPFQFRVTSNAFKKNLTLSVPFQTLQGTPGLLTVADGSGSDALSGGMLKASSPLSLVWQPVENATGYALFIYQGTNLVYSGSSRENSLLLHEGLPDVGKYTAVVEASFLSGDPYFATADFRSSFLSRGTAVQCTVVP